MNEDHIVILDAPSSPELEELLDEVEEIVKLPIYACLNESCGFHVHMSLPNHTLEEYPFHTVIFTVLWVATYQTPACRDHGCRDDDGIYGLSQKL